MPTSNHWLMSDVLTLVQEAAPKTVLDVGPGRGKFGVLIREYVPTLERLDAVEAWRPYITPLLECIYDVVWAVDVRDFSADQLGSYDLVLMSEVIEHLPKEDGLRLLARIPGHVVITTPEEFFESVDYPPTERHISHWTREDFGSRIENDRSRLGGIVVRLARNPGKQ